MKKILIIGGGWLGSPLAEKLSKQFSVIVTNRSPQIEKLNPFLLPLTLDLADPILKTETLEHFKKIDTVIGCFPPYSKNDKKSNYTLYWQRLIELCRSYQIRKIIMISSTSVYPENASTMTETKASYPISLNNPDFSNAAKNILQAEKQVIESSIDYTIIRLSGLFGPKRTPDGFLKYLTSVSDVAPANMIHLVDAIGLITFLVKNNHTGVVNGTTPYTVPKAEFYRLVLTSLNKPIDLPKSNSKEGKYIDPSLAIRLGYSFRYVHIQEAIIHMEDNDA